MGDMADMITEDNERYLAEGGEKTTPATHPRSDQRDFEAIRVIMGRRRGCVCLHCLADFILASHESYELAKQLAGDRMLVIGMIATALGIEDLESAHSDPAVILNAIEELKGTK